MKKQNGFTLIELVVVIVILGILAVTAAPKFLNLQTDARKSALQGLKGAMQGAGTIVYAKSAIEGKETDETETVADITVAYGYPTADEAGIGAAVPGLYSDWDEISGAAGYYTFKDADEKECSVRYEKATSGNVPSITVDDDKC
ncbi:MAG: type II secretion system protein [Aliivibrio sp.]|uniref:type II secretion system protein n=1 Tax=Aliivibrio sp. TaxID=1872443 RepID=UPI001A3C7288|nr:type II secretion system protein [Aliivibrio sp.]